MTDFSPGLSAFFKNAAALPLLTQTQEAELGRRAVRGDTVAINRLVEHNLRFAIKVAKGYRNRGIPFEDLVQHSAMGLHKAATKFDPDKGYRFTTYAMWWCNRYCQGAVYNESSTIRTPGHVAIRRGKIRAALEMNPDASTEDLAAAADCKPHHVGEAVAAARVVASLDEPSSTSQGDGVGDSMYGRIADPNAIMPGEIDELLQSEKLLEALGQLDGDERRVIELRFGFDGDVMSRDDVARRLRMEPHAVGRAQKSGLAKLRSILDTEGDEAVPPGRQGSSLLRPDSGLVPVCSRPGPRKEK